MPPSTLVGFLIVVTTVLPGAVYQWAFERQVSAFGVTLADRILRFIAVSTLFHLVLAWPEYALYRIVLAEPGLRSGQFFALWVLVGVLVVIPALVGSTLGGLYATRQTREGWRWFRMRISPVREDRILRLLLGRSPAPRAWDYFFSDRPTVYLRVRTFGGHWLAGRFARESYAGGFPHEADLLLEEAWDVDEDGQLGPTGLGYPLYISAGDIAWIEVVEHTGDGQEARHG